ncbi:MAG: type II toxin-antitoxin system Phd/YefM family antitoxin [Kiritimatiellae bacterium]|jgi:hypothetical protein|nr:type II toxin-antitoxin system Phd/YefM family antitoxin [Kiritimatiellia bacterium]
MIALHPNVLKKNGKKEFAVLPYEEFLKVQTALNDYADLMDLRDAKLYEKDSATKSLLEVREELGI